MENFPTTGVAGEMGWFRNGDTRLRALVADGHTEQAEVEDRHAQDDSDGRNGSFDDEVIAHEPPHRCDA